PEVSTVDSVGRVAGPKRNVAGAGAPDEAPMSGDSGAGAFGDVSSAGAGGGRFHEADAAVEGEEASEEPGPSTLSLVLNGAVLIAALGTMMSGVISSALTFVFATFLSLLFNHLGMVGQSGTCGLYACV